MSKECLNQLQTITKLKSSQDCPDDLEIATKKFCILYGADTSKLDKYTTDYECPADDDIVKLKTIDMPTGTYRYTTEADIGPSQGYDHYDSLPITLASAGDGKNIVIQPFPIRVSTIPTQVSCQIGCRRDPNTGIVSPLTVRINQQACIIEYHAPQSYIDGDFIYLQIVVNFTWNNITEQILIMITGDSVTV